MPPSQLRRGLARDLEAICLKCLEKRPSRRYGSAADLAADLRRFLAGEPTHARPLGRVGKALRWSGRHPTAVALLAMTAVSLAIVLGGGAWHVDRLSHELAINEQLRSEAEVRQQQQRHHQYLSDIQLGQRLWQEGKLAQTRRLLAQYIPVDGAEDLRNFAWHYLWQRCHHQLTTYQGHTGDVSAVAYSPDGQQIVTAGHDGTVRLFDTHSGEQLAVFRGHQGEVNCVAFTPDGQTLATGADDGTVRLWDVKTAHSVATLTGHEEDVLCLAISPEGTTLASGGIDKIIRLWNLEQCRLAGALEGHTDWIRGLAFSPDGTMLASGSDDASVILWHTETATELRLWDRSGRDGIVIRGHSSRAESIGLSANGRQLAFVDAQRYPRILRLDEPDNVRRLVGPPGAEFSTVAFHPNGQILATGNGSGTVWIWNLLAGASEKVPLTSKEHASIYQVQFSPDGSTLAAYDGNQHEVILYGLDSKSVREILPNCEGGMDFSPDGQLLATGANDRSLFIWNVGTGQVARILVGNDRVARYLEFSPDGKVLATIGVAGPIAIWNVESDAELLEIPVPFSNVWGLTFAPDGQSLMVSGSRRVPDGESEKLVSGVAFYSAGDPRLCGETFCYHVR